MDPKFREIFEKHLNISKTKFATALEKAKLEFEELTNKSTTREHHCSYVLKTGINKDKECGLLPDNLNKEAKFNLNGKWYCKSHYVRLSDIAQNSAKLKLKDIPKTVNVEQKIKTIKQGAFDVIEDTLLIVDKNTNSVSGALRKEQPTAKITVDEKKFLEKREIPHQNCILVENDNTEQAEENFDMDDALIKLEEGFDSIDVTDL